MTRKIFRSCFLVAVTVLLASLLLIMGALYEYFDSQYEEELRQETAYIAQGEEQGGLAYCQALEQERNLNTRITWIESDGTVRYDSQADASSLENHADREEVQQAMRNGTGFSVRRSDTPGPADAQLCGSAGRRNCLARQRDADHGLDAAGRYAAAHLFVLIVAVVLSLCLAHRVSRRVAEPINHIDLEHPLENNEVYDELAPFLTGSPTRTSRFSSSCNSSKSGRRNWPPSRLRWTKASLCWEKMEPSSPSTAVRRKFCSPGRLRGQTPVLREPQRGHHAGA